MSDRELAEHLARRDLQFRNRGVQVMLLCALVLRPLPEDVVDRITRYARAMSADDGMIPVARRFAEGSLGLAGVDFERNGYTANWDPARARRLHVPTELQDAWASAVADPALAERWSGLGDLAEGTLGRTVWEMYRARGFVFPGLPGSAPPLLAQHDWVHVPRRLRDDRRVRVGGVRVHRSGQRRHAGILPARHGRLPVRDRLPADRCGALRSERRTLVG